MNNIDDRINNIRSNRKVLLSMVRRTINENKFDLSSDVKDLVNVIKLDESNEKKYNEILKIRKLIEDISHKIMQSSSQKEIEDLRKELNKAISKVRKEVKARNIDSTQLESNITDLRKDISKYLRVVKRDGTLNIIEELNNRRDNLSDDEQQVFKKLLNRERSYNKRSIDDINKKKVVKEEDVDPLAIQIKKLTSQIKYTPVAVNTTANVLDTASSDEEFVSKKVNEFNSKFRISEMYAYNKGIPGNVISFIKNIPICMRNKQALKMAYFELNFSKPAALRGYVAYQRENNSIRNGLKSILGKSKLYSKDDDYLSTHENCVQWIINYCKDRRMDFSYFPSKSM